MFRCVPSWHNRNMATLRSSVPVDEAAQRHLAGESLRSLAREYGVTVHTLSRHLTRAGHPVRDQAQAAVAANLKRPRGQGSRGGKTGAQHVKELRCRKAAIIAKWKADRGCQRCGEMHPATLDLHHRDPAEKNPRLKRKNASTTRRTGGYFWRDLSFADLAEELAKCTVLCSNCHRIVEWETRGNAKGGDDPPKEG